MNNIKYLHAFVGVLGLLAYAGAQLYMRNSLDGMEFLADRQKVLYQSAAIILFLVSSFNIVIAVYLSNSKPIKSLTVFQWLSSWLILLSPFLAAYSFLYESAQSNIQRPVMFGLVVLFVVSMLSLLVDIVVSNIKAKQ